MSSLIARQLQNNAESRDSWELYRDHRTRVTNLILGRCPRSESSLTVLGAGNCNDLDLSRLTARFDQVSLVDLDRESVEAGIARQDCANHPSVSVYAPVDVTGLYSSLERNDSELPGEAQMAEAIHAATEGRIRGLPDPAHVVASTGLLSQLIESVDEFCGLGEKSIPLIQAVRRRHLNLMAELTRPEGHLLLLTEVVSSLTAPALLHCDASDLPGLIQTLVKNGNFFTGLNPAAIYADLVALKDAGSVDNVESVPPWKWTFLSRTYAVFALAAQCPTSPDDQLETGRLDNQA